MKYKVFKRCKKYREIYTKEKETKEIQIELNGIAIYIAEHQMGLPLNEPWVDIFIKDGCSYSMDLSTLIKKIIS